MHERGLDRSETHQCKTYVREFSYLVVMALLFTKINAQAQGARRILVVPLEVSAGRRSSRSSTKLALQLNMMVQFENGILSHARFCPCRTRYPSHSSHRPKRGSTHHQLLRCLGVYSYRKLAKTLCRSFVYGFTASTSVNFDLLAAAMR